MKLLVFDGNSIINRAFYAIKTLTTKDGVPTNALHGFLKLYLKYFEMSQPDMVAVAFDVRAKTFRHNMYAEYKAQRKGMPDELAMQMQPLKDILRAMNVCIYEKEGYEADDIIGTLAKYCTDNGLDCDIVSGDRDDFQLVNDRVRVIMPVTRGGMSEVDIFDRPAVVEKYGFEPPLIADLKAIMGDSSDNIKGVAGIGEKGALELVRQYGTLENIYDSLDSIKPSLKNKLEADRDNAFLSKTLATICTEVPMDIDTGCMTVKEFDNTALSALLDRYELRALSLAFDIKKTFFKARISDTRDGSQLTEYFRQNGLYFIMYNGKMYADIGEGTAEIENYLSLLTDNSIKKTTYKPKNLYRQLLPDIKDITPFYDIEVAQYVLDPSRSAYDLCDIINTHTGENVDKESDTYIQDLTALLKRTADGQWRKICENNQAELLTKIEFPLSVVLADMEINGFTVDTVSLEAFSKDLEARIADLEKTIYFQAGETFNINSPKQLGTVLFENLGLPHGKKTKNGYSTSADILEKLRGVHPVIEDILEYRQYVKLKSTYCDGLLKLTDGQSKIHTSFNQTVTQTGRISSTEPNLQNIPVRTPLGRELRRMFIAKEGNVLVDADYSQIELRVLSHIADDRAMLEAFARDEDIHTVTASSVFGVPQDLVTSEMRRAAKAVNFGIVYGISDFSLAQDIKTTKAKAKQYIDSYLDLYSGVREYMKEVVEKAKTDGYVSTLFNRRRYIPELKSSNYITRTFGERAAMNMPIQGSAADIIKIAMVNVRKALLKENLSAKLILQVHDELIIEAPESEREQVCELLSREMENAVPLNVRLKADVAFGRSWYDCK